MNVPHVSFQYLWSEVKLFCLKKKAFDFKSEKCGQIWPKHADGHAVKRQSHKWLTSHNIVSAEPSRQLTEPANMCLSLHSFLNIGQQNYIKFKLRSVSPGRSSLIHTICHNLSMKETFICICGLLISNWKKGSRLHISHGLSTTLTPSLVYGSSN